MNTSTAPAFNMLDDMRRMRLEGYADADIGRRHNISRQRVHQLLGPSGIDRRKGPHPRTKPTRVPSSAFSNALIAWRQAFSNALLAWRLRHGLTQAQATKVLHLSAISVYSKWETLGHCAMPDLVLEFIKLWETQSRSPKGLRDIPVGEPLSTTLQHWRARHGLTQTQAAAILRVTSKITLAQWEHGRGCALPNVVRDFIKLWEAHKNS